MSPTLEDLGLTTTPWDSKGDEIRDKRVLLVDFEPITTHLGPAYIYHVQPMNDEGLPGDMLKVLIGSVSLNEKADQLAALRAKGMNVLPLDIVFYKEPTKKGFETWIWRDYVPE